MINILPNQAVKLNYSVIQGTTPTFNLRIPATLDQSIISDVCIVFSQQRPIFSLSLSDCTLQDQVLSFTLTQQQTYNFRVGFPLLIQINVLATGGQVLASYIFSEEVKPNLCQSPFGASIAGQQPDPNVVDSTSSGLSSSEQRIGIDFGQIQNISGYAQAGEYDAETVYTAGQVVTYNGSSYVAKQQTVGNLPTDEEFWQLVASKGDAGFSPTIVVKTSTDDAYILTITDENGSYDTPNLKANVPNADVGTGIALTYAGDTVNIVESFVNLRTEQQTTEQINIALATSENAGLMSPASVEAIQQLTSDVAVLKGQTVRLAYDVKPDPTAQEIQAFVISEGYTDQTEWVHIAVVVVDTNYVWRYYTDDGWMQQTDIVSQFTNSVAGIIKGSELDGQVYAEDDGTGSVVGWDSLKTDVTNLGTGKVSVPTSVVNNHIVFWDVTNTALGDSGIAYTSVATTDTNQTISGQKSFTSTVKIIDPVTLYGINITDTQIQMVGASTYTFSFPTKNGTFAMTSDIPTALSQLTDDATHRLVTDTQIAAWDDKVDKNSTVTYSVYGTSTAGTQTTIKYGSLSGANSLILRDSNGNAEIATPTSSLHITNKNYVDTALGNKVDKTTTGQVVYGTIINQGVVSQTTIPYSTAANQGLVYRDGNGRAQVENPSANKDIANKIYVDSNLPTLQDWTV